MIRCLLLFVFSVLWVVGRAADEQNAGIPDIIPADQFGDAVVVPSPLPLATPSPAGGAVAAPDGIDDLLTTPAAGPQAEEGLPDDGIAVPEGGLLRQEPPPPALEPLPRARGAIQDDSAVRSSPWSPIPLPRNSERQLPVDVPFQRHAIHPDVDDRRRSGEVTVQTRLDRQVKQIKLEGLVPPIRFLSGQSDIPDEVVARLRQVLDDLSSFENVRLHFIGHTDTDQLGDELIALYGDNKGLSRARAEAVAEYLQRRLRLPPEAISYEGAGDAFPVADNNSAAGKAQNRRVEVQLWYDEVTRQVVEEEIAIPPPELVRVPLCRRQEFCIVRRRSAGLRKVQVRDLVAPLRFEDTRLILPPPLITELRSVLQRYAARPNVALRVIGHSDNTPLTQRAERIYGNFRALSKAQAAQVARLLQDELGLDSGQIFSAGKGDSEPVANNDTAQGRYLNRRIEFELWHDGGDGEAADEPLQACPDALQAETIEVKHRPLDGPLAPIGFAAGGKPLISGQWLQRLRDQLASLNQRSQVRLRFIGHVDSARLSRREGIVYRDHEGLSRARSRRVMEQVGAALAVPAERMEHEGRGFVTPYRPDPLSPPGLTVSNNRVEVEIWYDELALLEENENISIERITIDEEPSHPYGLNLMRISVDGQVIQDIHRHIADTQRCTDVALATANIRFRYDGGRQQRLLAVSAWPASVAGSDDPSTEEWQENRAYFTMYSNYPVFFERAEVRLLRPDQSLDARYPYDVVLLDRDGIGVFEADLPTAGSKPLQLRYVLRVYDKDGRFDQTAPQSLWISAMQHEAASYAGQDVLRQRHSVYGHSQLGLTNIPINGGTLTIDGRSQFPDARIWALDQAVPLGADGSFVAEQILPHGYHTAEVAVLDDSGNGNLYLRDMEIGEQDWFYVGLFDLTYGVDNTSGPARLLTGDSQHYNNEGHLDGRMAFYGRGKLGADYRLRFSVDSGEGKPDEWFRDFLDPAPEARLERLSKQRIYSSYGDDSSAVDEAPSRGKLYLKLEKDESYALWGNHQARLNNARLARIERDLYGAFWRYRSGQKVENGEDRAQLDLFAADAGSQRGYQVFRSSGGSIYFLPQQDVLTGSEQLYVEIRERESGLVLDRRPLVPEQDYQFNYLQGLITLSTPLPTMSASNSLVREDSLAGNPVYLVAIYEYSPGVGDLSEMASGGRASYWFSDWLQLGLTHSSQGADSSAYSLSGSDFLLRYSSQSYLRLELAQTKGQGYGELASSDAGYNFVPLAPDVGTQAQANAWRVETALALDEISDQRIKGNLQGHYQKREKGFSAPGERTENNIEQLGMNYRNDFGDHVSLRGGYQEKKEEDGLQTAASEGHLDLRMFDYWKLSVGGRQEFRRDDSAERAITQRTGDRSDAIAQLEYDSHDRWAGYLFQQQTLSLAGSMESNARSGLGARYHVNDRLFVSGEASEGDRGSSYTLKSDYEYSDRSNLYLHYGYGASGEDEGTAASRRGQLVGGLRSRYNEYISLYSEQRYTHGDVPQGLTQAYRVELTPNELWRFGISAEHGELKNPDTAARLQRDAYGLQVGYSLERLQYLLGLEYRHDSGDQSDVTSQLMRHKLRYQMTPSARLLLGLDYAETKQCEGCFGEEYIEGNVAYAYRPIDSDRLNMLLQYTYHKNDHSPAQLSTDDISYGIQRSHIGAVDVMFALAPRWSLGGKIGYRLGEFSLETAEPFYFQHRAILSILRAEWHVVRHWDMLVEGRRLEMIDLKDRRDGMLAVLYRHFGENAKLGVGYNWSDFSDDLTELDYRSHGVFINLVGKF